MSNVNIVNGDCGDHVCKADKKTKHFPGHLSHFYLFCIFWVFVYRCCFSTCNDFIKKRQKKQQTLSWFLTINCVCVLKEVSVFISSSGLENWPSQASKILHEVCCLFSRGMKKQKIETCLTNLLSTLHITFKLSHLNTGNCDSLIFHTERAMVLPFSVTSILWACMILDTKDCVRFLSAWGSDFIVIFDSVIRISGRKILINQSAPESGVEMSTTNPNLLNGSLTWTMGTESQVKAILIFL